MLWKQNQDTIMTAHIFTHCSSFSHINMGNIITYDTYRIEVILYFLLSRQVQKDATIMMIQVVQAAVMTNRIQIQMMMITSILITVQRQNTFRFIYTCTVSIICLLFIVDAD
jgi:hypothetical protein